MVFRKCDSDCDKPFDPTVKCFICNHACHISCYNINKTVCKGIVDLENVLFLCHECLANKKIVDANSNTTGNNAPISHASDNSSIVKAINDLTAIVVDMQTKMKNIEKPSYKAALTGNLHSVNTRSAAKRMRFMDNLPPDTPTSRPKDTIIGNNNEDKDLAAVETRKWIFVSQLHPSTSEQSLIDFTKKRLNDTNNAAKIQAFALVPKDRNRDELNFISFKVNIPESLYAEVLKPEIWPRGVIVRDFVNDQRRRRPTGHFLTKTPTAEPVL